jgi:formylglycine-generating enzyme required for sulfatase activity
MYITNTPSKMGLRNISLNEMDIFLVSLSSLSLVTGCSKVKPAATHSHTQNSTEAQLGSLQQCQQYSGLPEAWQNSKTAGMVWIPEGSFQLGSNLAYPDELNFGKSQRQVKVFGSIKPK